jgi:hypothetical protein
VFVAAWVSTAGIVNAAERAILFEDRRVTDDGTTFYKYVDSDGVIHASVYDKNGKEIVWDDQMQPKSDVVGERLAAVLGDKSLDDMLVVKIALRDPEEDNSSLTREHGVIDVEDGVVTQLTVNGMQRTLLEEDGHHFVERQNKLKARREVMRQKVRDNAMKVVAKHALNIPLADIEKYADNGESMTLTMKKSDLKKFLELSRDLIAAVDLPGKEIDNITTAMVTTGANQMFSFQSNPGAGIGIYMTESGCRDPAGFANYLRLAGSNTDHSRNVSGIIRAVSPNSFLYCRGGPALPQTAELAGVSGNPQIFIMTRSNGDANSSQYGTLDRDWDNFQYTHGVLHFNSAGNEGTGTGFISSPGKALSSVTVGDYNHRNNNTIAPHSSFVDPSTKNAKPELSAPGTSINAGGFTMTGTSMAAPHAAAISANFMSAMSFVRLRPALAKAQLMATALTAVAGGFNRVGVGGVRYPEGMGNYTAMWWEGANGCFDVFAVNNVISATFNISSIPRTRARVVVAWLNRGTWTYDHRNDAHPIGMDFDIVVYAPNGAVVGSSSSWDNPYEMVEFTPTQVGNYRLEIRRYANRDTASNLRLGAWIHRGIP